MPEFGPKPSRLFIKIFRTICKEELFEELHGDLIEEFYENVTQFGIKKARTIHKREVIKLIRPSVLRRFKTQPNRISNNTMLRNHAKIAFRSLSKNKLFTFINITGLAIGMSVGLLIVNLIFDAVKFDEFHQNKARLYRVISTPMQTGFHSNENATAPMALAEKMMAEVPGIQESVRIRRWFSGRLKIEEKSLFADGIYADNNFFEVFSFELEQGNPTTALEHPFSILLTKDMSEKLQPGVDLMGKLVTIPELGEFLVTGIVKNPPQHSHFHFDMIGSFSTTLALEQQGKITKASNDWRDFNRGYVYFLLEDGQDLNKLQSWLDDLGQETYEEDENFYAKFATQKVTGIIPGKDLNNQLGAEMMPAPIIILGGVAMLIILSACFNYTNLSIARAMRRSKEIGVRKIIGSSRGQIFGQFTIETIIVTVIAVFFSALIFLIIKPFFITSIPRINEIMQPENPPVLIIFFLLFAVLIGLIAGIFPALFFSKIKPLAALRANSSMKLFSRVNVRKALIIVQFSISIFFLITMNVVLKQYRFTMAYDMGFRSENLLNLSLYKNDHKKLITELKKIPEVNGISVSSMIVGTGSNNRLMLRNPTTNDSLYTNFISATPSYFDLHGIDIIAGSNYKARQPEEKLNQMMVNVEFTKFHGYESPELILGEQFYIQGKPTTITGVIEDFNYQYIEEAIHPLVIIESPGNFGFINLSIQGGDVITTLDKIENAWQAVDEENEMELQFMDAQLKETSGFLLIFTRVFGFLGFIAASIACLGLLGMAVFNAETRTKEIGIRKAVGASVSNLIMILSKNFIVLILTAGVIGAFLSYVVLDRLILAQIHYRVGVGFLEMLTAILILFALAAVAVMSQTWKAARANPVDSLRNE